MMPKYLESYAKMKVLRKMAKKMPNGILADILKTVDETWNKEIEKRYKEIEKRVPQKKKSFVTKF